MIVEVEIEAGREMLQSHENQVVMKKSVQDKRTAVVVDVISQNGLSFRIRWTATTIDVNYYDGSKPRARVEIEGDFEFAPDDYKKWMGL